MHRTLAVLTILTLTTIAWSMPPAPGLTERLREQGRLQSIADRHLDARQRGVNASFDSEIARLFRDGADEIEIRAICILVDFEDNEANRENYSTEHYEQMLFSRGEFRTGSMRDWYLENSYGDVDITGQVVGWYRMPHDYAYYVQGVNGFGEYPQNARGLTRDALRAADEDVDFREFDNDDNHVVEALFIVHAGPGAEVTGSDDMIWSHAWYVPRNLTIDGMRFQNYAMEPENGQIGVFGHELGHSLFDLPDLYDTSYESSGVGRWSMMSGGSWGGGGTRPVHFDAWCKYDIGFIDPFPIVQDHDNLVIEPAALESDVLMLWRDGEFNGQYFLLENRQQLGFDESLPGSGILIWHVDEAMEDNRNPWWPGRPSEPHNIVALEQADGRYDLEHDRNSGDRGDPFPGTGWNTTFGADTEPDSRDYRGRSTNITIHSIERADTIRYRLDISLSRDYRPEPLSLFLFNRIPDEHQYPHPDIRDEEVMTDELTLVNGFLRQLGVTDYEIDDQLPEDMDSFNTILYLESWRDSAEAGGGLTADEQSRLGWFLRRGGKLIMIGPDVATNIHANGGSLWEYMNAEYISEGVPAEDGNIQVLQANSETRLAGQTFPFQQHGPCDHYLDVVGAAEGSLTLFEDNNENPRGFITVGEGGYRVILQPFLFGGLIDWGGEKRLMLNRYMQYMQFQLAVPELEEVNIPEKVALMVAYPNPFNSELNITYRGFTPNSSMAIFDGLGRELRQFNITGNSGVLRWIPYNLPAGSYYLMAKGDGQNEPIRVVFLK